MKREGQCQSKNSKCGWVVDKQMADCLIQVNATEEIYNMTGINATEVKMSSVQSNGFKIGSTLGMGLVLIGLIVSLI